MSKAGSALAADNPGEGEGDETGTGTGGPIIEKSWSEGVDPKYAEAIKAKGWAGVDDVLESYTNVEKLVSLERGGDVDRILVKPKEDATPEEIAAFNAKVGLAAPEKAEDYGFTPEKIGGKIVDMFSSVGLPADLAEAFTQEMSPVITEAQNWFKEAGVPANLADKLVDQVLGREIAALKDFNANSDKEYNTLAVEMGDKFPDFEEAGRRAFRVSGLDQNILGKIEMAVGTKNMMQMFGKFGSALTEASAPSGERKGGGEFTQSADGAKSRIKVLEKDNDFQAKLMSTNPEVRKAAQKEWETLFEVAYPPT